MKKRIKKLKQSIDIKEVLLRFMILLITIVLVYYSDNTSRQVLNIVGFLIAKKVFQKQLINYILEELKYILIPYLKIFTHQVTEVKKN